MKEMSKVKIYQKKAINLIKNELTILSNLRHPLISNLYYAFQDKENLYLIMDYLSGGDLRQYIKNYHLCKEDEIKFIISNIIVIFEYLYENNIIHRDLKPENLIFDKNGYLHLTDFGIAITYNKNKKIKKLGGTPYYVAPEIYDKKSKIRNFSMDYFSLGVIIYELIFGNKPYSGKNKIELLNEVQLKEVKIEINDLPKNFNNKNLFCDFINKLLKLNPKERLGSINGISELKNHPLFENCNWDNILNKKIISPFVNKTINEQKMKRINSINDEIIIDNYKEILDIINKVGYFKEYNYNYFEKTNNKNISDDNLSTMNQTNDKKIF